MAELADLKVIRRWVGSSVEDSDDLDADLVRLGSPLVVALELLSTKYADRLDSASELTLTGDAALSWVENLRHLSKRLTKLGQACAALTDLNDEALALVSEIVQGDRKVDVVTVVDATYQNVRRS